MTDVIKCLLHVQSEDGSRVPSAAVGGLDIDKLHGILGREAWR